MTVSAGNTALASDYEELRLRVNAWFYDADPLCSFGSIFQQFGMGGDPTPQVLTGDEMLSDQMNEIIDRLNIGVAITSVSGTLPRLFPGQSVLASQYNTADAKDTLIMAQNNNIVPTEISSITGTSDQRTTSYATDINAVFRYTFSSFNAARYFFNSGGSLDLRGVQSGGSGGTGKDTLGIRALLTTMGVISMNYTLTTQSGSGGSTTTIGYYDLTTTYQQIFQQAGSGAYSNAYVTLQARRSPLGEYVEVRFVVSPEAGRTVDGTTTAYADYKKLDDQSSGDVLLQIDPPSTVTVINTFE
jgi:hypothetical protein